MSTLVSLYKSISDEEISRLKNDVIKSEGVAFLNSRDEGFLLSLAYAEGLKILIALLQCFSLGKKCTDFGLNRFDLYLHGFETRDPGFWEAGIRVEIV
ncbi:UNVERIFIED_CONTAM: hypothetical protein Sangu_1482200 [Sesamum angustifolium]|uniref:DUF3475 domain-containing protein n=1 Tax=Sesamum angustifolium TaxID=2727405 RepID=A0AAW2MQ19_9LAMI